MTNLVFYFIISNMLQQNIPENKLNFFLNATRQRGVKCCVLGGGGEEKEQIKKQTTKLFLKHLAQKIELIIFLYTMKYFIKYVEKR